jgi:hypothetical protein
MSKPATRLLILTGLLPSLSRSKMAICRWRSQSGADLLDESLDPGRSGAELEKYLDVLAFPHGDLFYIQKLVAAIENQSQEYSTQLYFPLFLSSFP